MKYLTVHDQMGYEVIIPFPPRRIVSLVPSQTEFLLKLGLSDEVIGVTKFCTHPRGITRSKVVIGGTKNFDFETIDRLNPDLIIGNKEENYAEGIELLRKRYPVWMSDISTLDDALSMMSTLGVLTEREGQANEIVQSVKSLFSKEKIYDYNALYLIWRKPWMAAGKSTFIDDMMMRAGLHNVLTTERYPVLGDSEINSLSPDIIFLSSEPYPFKEKHVGELQVIAPRAKILLVDGEMFSWYGSRLLYAWDYFSRLPI